MTHRAKEHEDAAQASTRRTSRSHRSPGSQDRGRGEGRLPGAFAGREDGGRGRGRHSRARPQAYLAEGAEPKLGIPTNQSAAGRHSKQLSVAFGINLGLFVAEVVGGLLAGSLALLADAGHMLVDTVAIGLSLAAIWFARRSPTPKRSFGYYRLEILAAVINGMLLFGVGIAVLVGAILRLMNPPSVSSGIMLVFGFVALVGNSIAAWLLLRGQTESLTMRAAFLDFLADAYGALAVIIAAIIIGATGYTQADAFASIVIALIILPRTWKLLGKTINVLLEATPDGVDLEEVRRHILETEGVAGSHDLHVWTISSGMNVLSVHVILKDGADGPMVLDRLGDCLADHFDIEHSTFQLEPATHRDHERAIHS